METETATETGTTYRALKLLLVLLASALAGCGSGTGVGGQSSNSTNSTPPANPTPAITSFSASPNVVVANRNTMLSWSSTNTTSCTAAGAWSGNKALSGSQTVGPLTASGTYTLNCTGPNGNASRSVNVTVSADFTVDTSWVANSDTPDGYNVYIGSDTGNITTLAKILAKDATDWNPVSPSAQLASDAVLAAVGTVKQVCVAIRAFNSGGVSAASQATCAALP